MKKATQSRILVFILARPTWLALTLGGGWQEIAAGAVVALIVTLAAGRFWNGFPRLRGIERRILGILVYGLTFLWEMIKANLHVAYLVLHPHRPIKPGIVKIRTALTKDLSWTVLADSITLTPGTLTVDVDSGRRTLYVHCSTVGSEDTEKNTAAISGKFERILKGVFE